MLYIGQFKFILCLAYWYLQSETFEFEWDGGNSSKSNSKHGVSSVEIEEVFELRFAVPIGRQTSPEVDEERLCIVGPTSTGKMISVVFTLRDGRVRPISSTAASRKGRKLYEEVCKTLERI